MALRLHPFGVDAPLVTKMEPEACSAVMSGEACNAVVSGANAEF